MILGSWLQLKNGFSKHGSYQVGVCDRLLGLFKVELVVRQLGCQLG